MWLEPLSLDGQHVSLETLTLEHTPELAEAVQDGQLWQTWYTHVPKPDDMEAYVRAALSGMDNGGPVFAVRSKASGSVVGCTRFYQVNDAHRRASIGYTWYAKSAQRTPINTETKWLLLRHAFETKGAIAIGFETHFFNQASRRAIERLGAKQDGILRNHKIMPDGSYRDSVVYSILQSEWPAVKQNLLAKLSVS